MPTGYTASINDKTTLRSFALNCARAFFYDLDGDLPESMPMPTYHSDRIAEIETKLAALEGMSSADAEAAAATAYAALLETVARERVAQDAKLRTHRHLLEQVEAWKAPDELGSLRSFMLEQLRTTIAADFPDFDRIWPKPRRKTAAEWIGEQRNELSRSLVYHREGAEKNAKQNRETNEWLKVLRAGLPP